MDRLYYFIGKLPKCVLSHLEKVDEFPYVMAREPSNQVAVGSCCTLALVVLPLPHASAAAAAVQYLFDYS